ncbi:2-amino-4-hydroxy-6-hydroxymethyldihydropteridine diphosphokinase [Steroidobacter sp.]|uniref:2-amino-4-hydroxy-6- hydroxymethyldihydropteridine diphosphokinase n=1 Tax=Steroidobacter sp. TaxID=1978227 RepID=UPI001A4CB94E|nr:2-amino-4-hydroxy-6-hydroxymethyldihydropteridine diphosphokinase [Steroidobacter sp.]MBL8269791.1 2-amino-4-hydroxy-6-hydroxymethyldihydropteridine diphosphokinase [Steroidobacter sp.]
MSAGASTAGSLWFPAYVALGSNLDRPAIQLERAFAALDSLPQCRLLARSRLYKTQPLGPQDQPEFINAAAGLLTTLTARELLVELKRLEGELGRAQPVVRWGPRLIDLDLLMHADTQISESDLTVPHPGLPERNFVLYPLRDIAPELLVPGHGRVSQLAARVGGTGLALLTGAPGGQ